MLTRIDFLSEVFSGVFVVKVRTEERLDCFLA